MVKITNPSNPEGNKHKINMKHTDDGLEIKLTPVKIKEMLKSNQEPKTTSVHLRLNQSITDQIKHYAKQHETTVTTVITDILTNHFSTKRIMKGVLELDAPVTLIIPTSMELIKDYMENNINIISDVTNVAFNMYHLGYDTQKKAFEQMKEEKQLITISQVNNLLDVYDYTNHCYYDDLNVSETDYPNVDEDEFMYHRGILLLNVKTDTDKEFEKILLEVLTYGNELIEARFINVDIALDLAKKTYNNEITEYLATLEDVNSFDNVIDHRIRELNLKEQLRIQQEINDDLRIELTEARLESDGNRELINERLQAEDNVTKNTEELVKYIQELEAQNRVLNNNMEKLKAIFNTIEK